MCIVSRKNFYSDSSSSNADKIQNNMSTQEMKILKKGWIKCGNKWCVKKTEIKARKEKEQNKTIKDLYPVNCKNAN